MSMSQFLNTLEIGIYLLSRNKINNEYFLSPVKSPFILKGKDNAKVLARHDKVIKEFKRSIDGIAVTSHGLKGTGKTMLAKRIANTLLKDGYPIILIEEGFSDTEFKKFITGLGNVVLIFDEFTTTYNQKLQEDLLSFFDGATSAKRLILLTTNYENALADQMKNRPGRVYYSFKFTGLLLEDVLDYVDDTNLTDEIKKYILYIVNMRDDVSWDILNALINEGGKTNNLIEYSSLLSDLNSDVNVLNEIVIIPHGSIKLHSESIEYKTNNGLKFDSLFFKYESNTNKRIAKRFFRADENYQKYQLGMEDEDSVEITISEVDVIDLFLEGKNVKMNASKHNRSGGVLF